MNKASLASNMEVTKKKTSNISSNSTLREKSAKATALSCPSERQLRVPCYCEENVWRLAYRRLHSKDVIALSENSNGSGSNKGIDATGQKVVPAVSTKPCYYVVFISNEQKCCPMMGQLASTDPKKPCWWDYHVILLQVNYNYDGISQLDRDTSKSEKKTSKSKINPTVGSTMVWDMDSHLPYPCTLEYYLKQTFALLNFMEDEKDVKRFSPRFRAVEASEFVKTFSSDRMHMFNEENGTWYAPPPTYDCIFPSQDVDCGDLRLDIKGRVSNLFDFVTMKGAGDEKVSDDGERYGSDNNCVNSAIGSVFTLEEMMMNFGG